MTNQVTTTDADISRVARQVCLDQLADMPWQTVVDYVLSRGYVLRPAATHGGEGAQPESAITVSAHRYALSFGHGPSFRPSSLPPGYPPLADEDALPFEVGRDE